MLPLLPSCLGQPEAQIWVSMSHVRAMGCRSLVGGVANVGAEIRVVVDLWDCLPTIIGLVAANQENVDSVKIGGWGERDPCQ